MREHSIIVGMENFIFGLQNSAYAIHHTILIIVRHQVVWGVALGIGIATLIHLLVSVEDPRHLPHMLTRSASASFDKLAPRNPDGTYQMSYSHFEHEYNRLRFVFYSAVLVFLIIVCISLLRYS
jgi:hypothetical protein